MTIAVYGNIWQKHSLKGLQEYLTLAFTFGSLVVEADFYDFMHENIPNLPAMRRANEFPADADLLLSFGGDGTLLRAVQWAALSSAPVYGVNTGHLGYLSMFDVDKPELLGAYFRNPPKPEPRTILEIEGERLPHHIWPYALNEVAILKQSRSSMVNVKASVDGIYLTDYLGDGLIVSTATGSTGYNLSVGGPILQPDSRALILSPIAPHTLTMRPLIVDEIEHVTLEPTSRAGGYTVSLDGQTFDMPQGTKLTIRRAPRYVNVVRQSGDDFAHTLRTKLLWGTNVTG